MKMFELNLPLADNAGKPLDKVHAVFQKLSLSMAGGYTKRPSGEGAWMDPETEKVYYDRIVPYLFVCEAGTFEQIRGLAFNLFTDQKAIFWRELDGATIERRPAARVVDRANGKIARMAIAGQL